MIRPTPSRVHTELSSLLATFREHFTLVRAVIEAAGYDDAIATYWETILGRFHLASLARRRRFGGPRGWETTV